MAIPRSHANPFAWQNKTKNPAFAGFSLILIKSINSPTPYSTANLVLAVFFNFYFPTIDKVNRFYGISSICFCNSVKSSKIRAVNNPYLPEFNAKILF